MVYDRHGEESGHDGHLDHGHVRSQIAKMQKGEYGPTTDRISCEN